MSFLPGLTNMLSSAWSAIKPVAAPAAALTAAYFGMPALLGAAGIGGGAGLTGVDAAMADLAGSSTMAGAIPTAGLSMTDLLGPQATIEGGQLAIPGGAQLSPLSSMMSGMGLLSSLMSGQLNPQALMSMMGSGTPDRALGIAPWLRTGMGLFGLGQGMGMMRQARLPNPGDVQGLPGYQAGIDAVMRGSRAANNGPSGAELAALQQYGGNAYNQAVGQRLSSVQGQMLPYLMMMQGGGMLEGGLAGTGSAPGLLSMFGW